MSWIERSVEQRIRQAIDAGELDTPDLAGKPLDLDTPRSQGWWADGLVERERSHDRRQVAQSAADRARVAFWRAATVDEVRALVGDANAAIDHANLNLVPGDRLELFDVGEVEARWRELRRRS